MSASLLPLRPGAREIPRIFSAPSVRAILKGRKTQTRRLVKDANSQGNFRASELRMETAWVDGGPSPAGNPGPYFQAYLDCKAICARRGWKPGDCDPEIIERLYPRVFPGDRLWVREAWQYDPAGKLPLIYRASNPEGYAEMPGHLWRSPIFMPRLASRISLEVAEVRAQRLREISEEDALAEGVSSTWKTSVHAAVTRGRLVSSARAAFIDGFTKLNKLPAEADPWVWAYTFRRIEG